MDVAQAFYQAVAGWLVNIVLVTDPAATYSNPDVQRLWLVALYITDSLSAFFFVFAGYQIIFAGISGRSAQVLELLPRVIFSLIAAHLSLFFVAIMIGFNNDVCQLFLAQRDTQAFFVHVVETGPFLLPFLIVLGVLMLLFCLQMGARIALIDFLIVILPWLFLLLASRSTEHVGRAGIEALLSSIFLQVGEIILLTLGINVVMPFFASTVVKESPLSPYAGLIVGIALFVLMLQLPVILSRIVSHHPFVQTGGALRTLATMVIARII